MNRKIRVGVVEARYSACVCVCVCRGVLLFERLGLEKGVGEGWRKPLGIKNSYLVKLSHFLLLLLF